MKKKKAQREVKIKTKEEMKNLLLKKHLVLQQKLDSHIKEVKVQTNMRRDGWAIGYQF